MNIYDYVGSMPVKIGRKVFRVADIISIQPEPMLDARIDLHTTDNTTVWFQDKDFCYDGDTTSAVKLINAAIFKALNESRDPDGIKYLFVQLGIYAFRIGDFVEAYFSGGEYYILFADRIKLSETGFNGDLDDVVGRINDLRREGLKAARGEQVITEADIEADITDFIEMLAGAPEE